MSVVSEHLEKLSHFRGRMEPRMKSISEVDLTNPYPMRPCRPLPAPLPMPTHCQSFSNRRKILEQTQYVSRLNNTTSSFSRQAWLASQGKAGKLGKGFQNKNRLFTLFGEGHWFSLQSN